MADGLRCPVCLCGYAAGGLLGKRAGGVCGNMAMRQAAPCVGRLMPQDEFDRADWIYPREYGAPDPRRKIRVD